MKINFKCPILNEKQKPMDDVDSAHLTSLALLSPRFHEGDLIKKYSLATKIDVEKEIEIDDADFNLVKKALEFVESGLTPIAAAQILIHINNEKLKQTK